MAHWHTIHGRYLAAASASPLGYTFTDHDAMANPKQNDPADHADAEKYPIDVLLMLELDIGAACPDSYQQ
ncbi:MAG: hypothetical protein HZT40_12290 [Candidatus Thiothrix singaporensis]|uniref:Uncharacterized protein n=1 Tax=Candidatus Thiothrix singaporensis TaxID=2799669 RepID=A0A7L6AT58_9GAMM|nr:MAG: hypothetical protein HZT40_12290 [Candidatus Thiothrix singaporensis]